ncbi:hypothetical protein L7F22_048300 [Adiantum nelumboides]|nr:hypothetical protein [Adiantum nelumboides]
MATRSQQLDWQEIHLSEDEASTQGTHAVRFIVQQVEKAQNNYLLRPMLNNLMRAHGLQLLNYEPPRHDPTFQEVLNEGNTREEREDHSQDDVSSGRSRSPSRRTRRPLEREDNSLRNRVQKSGSKRRRSHSCEVSSSPSSRVPSNLNVGQFMFVICKRIKLVAEEYIFIFVNNVLPPTAALMSSLYEEHKDQEGFLYVTYSGQNTFGFF